MLDRYSRQIVLEQIGPDGQQTLSRSKAAIIGCGALGTNIAGFLTRAGIGDLLIIDRDLVELNNIQRQTLFDETDVGKPKALAAAEKLKTINSGIDIHPLVKDLHSENIGETLADVDVVLDATDNIPIRMVVNDFCVKNGIPWVYAGVIRTRLMVMSIVPGGPCLRCILPEVPPVGEMMSCEVAGILNTVPAIAAAIESTETLKILLGKKISHKLIVYDVWEHQFDGVHVTGDPLCGCCVKHEYKYLETPQKELVLNLCENSVQIIPAKGTSVDLKKIAGHLQNAVDITANDYMLRFQADGKTITIFNDGRGIVKGTGDKGAARSAYMRYLGM